ncbi:hypothetical protein FRC03_004551 [Tulasnella sp. 419]|nr:hypothetical protein FRC03_004551 [Tulasnella sp. 419]
MEVILIYNLRARAFLAAVRGNPSLGRATKILDISDDILSTEPNLAYKITAKCPNLYRLTHCIPPHIGQKSLQSLLYPRTFTTLQALVLQLEPPPEKYASETSLMHFLRQFSSLSHLILENVHLLGKRPLNPFLFTYSPPSPPFELPPPPPSFKLKEFGWITGSHYQGSLGTFKSIVTWLFQEPSNGPLYFHTNVEDPRGHSKILVWFIENYGRNLISISASVEREGPPSAAIDLSVACPNLCELILPWAEIFPQQFQTLIPLNRLKHLELSAGMPWSRYSVTDMITVIDWIMSLPELQLVTLNFYKPKANPNDALVRLWKERCAPSVKIVIHDYLALKLVSADTF